jgi:pSer/pThr/pTyr-binding forkhead associated (FHA) protein
MQAVLVMFRSDGDRRSFSVTRDITVIGRREDCDLRIPLGEISRKHCRLVRDGDSLHLEDLGSSNGTYHNGQRVQEAILSPGDSIQVGPLVFVLQVDGVPPEDELAPVIAAGSEEGHEEQLLGDDGPLQPTAQSEFGGEMPTLDESPEELAPVESHEPAGGAETAGEDLSFDDLMAAELSGSNGGAPHAAGADGDEPTAHDGGLGLDELDLGETPLEIDDDEAHPDPLKSEGEHESSPHPH